jgi:hypothetical protein
VRRAYALQLDRPPAWPCPDGGDLHHLAEQVGRFLGDVTLTAAILDRLAMHAVRIDVDGPIDRQPFAQDRAERRAERRAAQALSLRRRFDRQLQLTGPAAL